MNYTLPNFFTITEGKNKNGQTVISLHQTGVENFGLFTEPIYLRAWYDRPPTQTEIEVEIMLNNYSRWNKELKADREPIEVSEHVYYEMLSVLPPHIMNKENGYFEVGEPNHHENGTPIHRAFYQAKSGAYFTCHPACYRLMNNQTKTATI